MSVLQDMIDDAPDQIEALESSLSQIQDQIDDLTIQINGIQNELCNIAESNLTAYLDGTKLAEIEILYGDSTSVPFSVDYGANYGTINYTTGGITDFKITDNSSKVEYEYLGTNWDGDPIITKLITDYAFGNDYLTRPLSTSATYGLIPSRDSLYIAQTILTNNKTKIENSETIFEDYA